MAGLPEGWHGGDHAEQPVRGECGSLVGDGLEEQSDVESGAELHQRVCGGEERHMEVQNATLDSSWAQRGAWTVTAPPSADYSLGMTPSSQSVGAGGSTTYTVTVTGSNGFSGTVNLGVSGLPSGVTGSFK